jgi:FkbM family methyltransferase
MTSMASKFNFIFDFIERLFKMKGLTWHESINSICSNTLHVPMLAHAIESILFRSTWIWEQNVSRLLASTKGGVFVDVGACLGRYEVLLGKKYKKIIAIEPERKNLEQAMLNTACAKLSNVRFVQCAVSDKNGYDDLYIGPTPNSHKLLETISDKNRRYFQRGTVRVRTSTLVALLGNLKADLIKVDAQGAEWLILEGAKPVLKNIGSWLVELHNTNRRAELENWFTTRGYSTKWVDFNHLYAWK